MFFHRKALGKRGDVDTISSSGSDITDLSTESGDDYDSERERQLEREWEEGMEHLKMITTIVLLPFFGKWLGKKWAYLCEFSTFDVRRDVEWSGVTGYNMLTVGVYSACKVPKSGIRTPVLRNLAVEGRFVAQGVMSAMD